MSGAEPERLRRRGRRWRRWVSGVAAAAALLAGLVVGAGTVILHPPVATEVPCRKGISGGAISIDRLTEQQARALSVLLVNGPLPVRLGRRPRPP